MLITKKEYDNLKAKETTLNAIIRYAESYTEIPKEELEEEYSAAIMINDILAISGSYKRVGDSLDSKKTGLEFKSVG